MKSRQLAHPHLDVILNGKRQYVQGTQMIARSAEIAAAQKDSSPVILQAATFHRITDKAVQLHPGMPDDNSSKDRLLGTLSFVSDSALTHYTLLERQNTAPRGEIAPRATWTRRNCPDEGRLSAAFDVDGLEQGEDLLVAIVQTIKGLHESLAPDVQDVWLTGFRAGNIPMSGTLPFHAGILTIQARRSMKGDGIWQTLQMASFVPANDAPPLRVAVTFAFKSETLSHVD